MSQPDQEISKKEAIQLALHERNDCRARFESIHQLALSRSAIAICQLATIEFTRLEKLWRRDPSHYRDIFATNHLGAAHLADRWATLADALEEQDRMPSLDLILECVCAEGSPVSIQNINDDGLFLIFRFLLMQESPDRAISAWLKLSKCVDLEHFRERIEFLVEKDFNSRTCRLELFDLARKRAAEWKDAARSARKEFEIYSKTLQNSPVPACHVDRTLGSAFRDAQSRFNRAERKYQALLKKHGEQESPLIHTLSTTSDTLTNTTNITNSNESVPTSVQNKEHSVESVKSSKSSESPKSIPITQIPVQPIEPLIEKAVTETPNEPTKESSKDAPKESPKDAQKSADEQKIEQVRELFRNYFAAVQYVQNLGKNGH